MQLHETIQAHKENTVANLKDAGLTHRLYIAHKKKKRT